MNELVVGDVRDLNICSILSSSRKLSSLSKHTQHICWRKATYERRQAGGSRTGSGEGVVVVVGWMVENYWHWPTMSQNQDQSGTQTILLCLYYTPRPPEKAREKKKLLHSNTKKVEWVRESVVGGLGWGEWGGGSGGDDLVRSLLIYRLFFENWSVIYISLIANSPRTAPTLLECNNVIMIPSPCWRVCGAPTSLWYHQLYPDTPYRTITLGLKCCQDFCCSSPPFCKSSSTFKWK